MMSGTEKKPTEQELEIIKKESAARRIAYVSLVGALRELKNSYVHDAVFEDKYIINQSDKAINRMYEHFDKQGLMNHKVYDSIVNGIVDYVETHREYIFKIMTEQDGGSQEDSDVKAS